MSKIAPCLWFNGEGEEAARFYVSLFQDSAIDVVIPCGDDMPFPAGSALMVEFRLAGQRYQVLNGGPQFPQTEAVSLSVSCKDQAEVDFLWDALIANGGAPSQCGWLKDRFGVSWQIVPQRWNEIMSSADKKGQARAMQAMMTMSKFDIAALETAFKGE
mgnify:FL=1|tara:strand:+ start:1018 stop:1494 length:477 start_codon:yes stop_codon:yes gene_type:complete